MMHSPIILIDISLSFAHKTCFEDFSATVPYGSRIAIIGNNGSGKSTLLKYLYGMKNEITGTIKRPTDARIGYVGQIIEDYHSLSGAQRFNKALTGALSGDPNLLLLDEPTNHLDISNRNSLLRMLNSYSGTLIIVSHDVTLLNHYVDTLWHIDNGIIKVFSGSYDALMADKRQKRATLEAEITFLKQQKSTMHQALMKEQQRAKKSRAKGFKSIEERKWPTITSHAKANRASQTAGRNKAKIADKAQDCIEKLATLSMPKVIKAQFSIDSCITSKQALISSFTGNIGYEDKTVLNDISLSIYSDSRIAIMGDNGSGKSTLLKALTNDPKVTKTGEWHLLKPNDVGMLDQHYESLNPSYTVLASIQALVPTWPQVKIREFLSTFLFCKNEEVENLVSVLSGGEKARLTLAKIAAKPPKLLILDEITNNLDLQTKEHVIQVLQDYPGAMIVISHDTHFLKAINIKEYYLIKNSQLVYAPL